MQIRIAKTGTAENIEELPGIYINIDEQESHDTHYTSVAACLKDVELLTGDNNPHIQLVKDQIIITFIDYQVDDEYFDEDNLGKVTITIPLQDIR